jgi:hypothetical protein
LRYPLIAMADARIVNLYDATMVEKRDHGRPRGSKNKPKASATDASSSTPAKRCRGRPLGRLNKAKTSVAPTSTAEHLDVSLAQSNLSQSSAGNWFSFFAFCWCTVQ